MTMRRFAIANTYVREDGAGVTITTFADVDVPATDGFDSRDDWLAAVREAVFPHTGTGRIDGDAAGYEAETADGEQPHLRLEFY